MRVSAARAAGAHAPGSQMEGGLRLSEPSVDVVEGSRLVLGRDGPAHLAGDLLSLLKQLEVGRVAGRIVEQL